MEAAGGAEAAGVAAAVLFLPQDLTGAGAAAGSARGGSERGAEEGSSAGAAAGGAFGRFNRAASSPIMPPPPPIGMGARLGSAAAAPAEEGAPPA